MKARDGTEKKARNRLRPSLLESVRERTDTATGLEHHHRDVRGGAARAAIFGVSDGLVSNVALILGVAAAHPHHSVVVLVGLAGMLAGSFSMATGEYVSMRAQAELLERELEMELREIRRHPQAEQRELARIYEARGLDTQSASDLAGKLMADPELALHTHAREELGIDPDSLGSPWQAAISSLIATALGAAVPLVPWLVSRAAGAIAGTVVASFLLAIGVGVALSRFTGRSAVLSAGRQVLICSGAAAVTYGVGALVGVAGA